MINVIASENTVTGESEQPGYLEGYGVIDADLVRQLGEDAALRLVECPTVSPRRPCATNRPLRWSAGSAAVM